MFKNGMLIADYKDELVGKYGYPEALAEDIAMMTESIVDHFGTEYEPVILDAIRATKVVLVDNFNKKGTRETVADVLEREGMADAVAGISAKDLRGIEEMYCEKPHITYGPEGYSLASVDRVAVINNEYIPENIYFRSKLTSVLLKAVKAHLQAYSIEGDTLTIKRGLAVRTEKLSHVGDAVTRELVGEFGYGLENGLNSYDTLFLVRTDYYSYYDLQNHSLSVLVAGNLIDGLNIKDIVREAQVTKDIRALREVIDAHTTCGYVEFMRRLDTLHDLELGRNATIDNEDRMVASDDLEAHYKDSVAPMMRDMRVSMKMTNVTEMDIQEGKPL